MPLGGIGANREIMMIIRARNEAGRVFTSIGTDFDNLNRKASQAAAQTIGMGAALTAVGVGFAAVGVAGLAFYKNAIGAAADYDKQSRLTVTQIHKEGEAILSNEVKLKRVKDIGLEVAKSIPVPFKEIQGALYDIFSTTELSIDEARDALKLFGKAAVAGDTDLRGITRTAIDLKNNFNVPMEKMPGLMSAIFEAVRQGKGDYDDFANNIGRAASSARRFGQDLPTLLGTIAAVSRLLPSMGNTVASVGRMFDAFAKARVVERLERMGVAVKDARGEFLPFTEIIRELGREFLGLTGPEVNARLEALFKGAGGTIQAFRGIIPLVLDEMRALSEGTESHLTRMIRAVTAAFGDNGALLEQAFATMMEGPAAKMQMFLNLWDTLKVSVGQAVLPIATTIVEFASKVVEAFLSMDEGTQKFLSQIGLLLSVSSVVVGGITAMAGVFLVLKGALDFAGISAGTFFATIGGLSAAVLAFAGLALIVVRNWDTLKGFWEEHKALVTGLALAITATLIPSLVRLGTTVASLTLAKMGEMLMTLAYNIKWDALANGISQVAASLKAMAGGQIVAGLMHIREIFVTMIVAPLVGWLAQIGSGLLLIASGNIALGISAIGSALGRIAAPALLIGILLWIDALRNASERADKLKDSWIKMANESEAPTQALKARIDGIVGKLDEEGQAWFRLTGKVEDNRTIFEKYILRKKAAVTEAEIRFVEAAQREMQHADELAAKTGLSADAVIGLANSINVDLSKKGREGFGKVIEAAEQFKNTFGATVQSFAQTRDELGHLMNVIAAHQKEWIEWSSVMGGGTESIRMFVDVLQNEGIEGVKDMTKELDKLVEGTRKSFDEFNSILGGFNEAAAEEGKARIQAIDDEIAKLKGSMSEGTKSAVSSMNEVLDSNKNTIAELKRRNIELNIEAKDASEERYEQIIREVDQNKVRMAQLQEQSTVQRSTSREIKETSKDEIETRIAHLEQLKAEEEKKTSGSIETVKRFFETSQSLSKQFLGDIQTLLKAGLDPSLVSQALLAGPEKAAPLLRALVQGNIDENVRLVNSGVESAKQISQAAVEVQRIMNKAMRSETDITTGLYDDAIRVAMEKMKQGAEATRESVAAALKLDPKRIDDITTHFGIHFNPGIQRNVKPVDIDATTHKAESVMTTWANKWAHWSGLDVPVGADTTVAEKDVVAWVEYWKGWEGIKAKIGANMEPADKALMDWGKSIWEDHHWYGGFAAFHTGTNTDPAVRTVNDLYNDIAGDQQDFMTGANTNPAVTTVQNLYNDIAEDRVTFGVDVNVDAAIANMQRLRDAINAAHATPPADPNLTPAIQEGPRWYGGIEGAQLGGVFRGRLGRGVIRRIAEQGPELILPLTRPERMRELLGLERVQQALQRAMVGVDRIPGGLTPPASLGGLHGPLSGSTSAGRLGWGTGSGSSDDGTTHVKVEEGAIKITVQGSIDDKVLPAVEAALQRSLKEVLRSHKAGRTRR